MHAGPTVIIDNILLSSSSWKFMVYISHSTFNPMITNENTNNIFKELIWLRKRLYGGNH